LRLSCYNPVQNTVHAFHYGKRTPIPEGRRSQYPNGDGHHDRSYSGPHRHAAPSETGRRANVIEHVIVVSGSFRSCPVVDALTRGFPQLFRR
jgi:hypothetical protein